MFKSTDSGQNWTEVTRNLPVRPLMSSSKAVLIHPGDPDTLYIFTNHRGIWKNVTGGSTDWFQINNGLPDTVFGTYVKDDNVIHPLTFTVSFILTSSGVVKTTNGGALWVLKNNGFAPGDSARIRGLKRVDYNPDILYAGTSTGIVYRSVNDAETWTALNTADPVIGGISDFYFNELDTNRLYVPGTNGNYSYSTDGGVSWQAESTHVPGYTGAISMAVDPANSNNLYMDGNAGMYKSTDRGATWAFAGAGLGGAVNRVAIDPRDHAVIYCGGTNGLWKSGDRGATWSRLNSGFPATLLYPEIRALVLDPGNPDIVYVGGYSASFSIYKSTDAGASWALRDSGLAVKLIRSLCTAGPDTLYALTTNGLFKTVDGGGLWQAVPGIDSFAVSLYVDPVNHQRLYAGMLGPASVNVSTDGGGSWSNIALGSSDTTAICVTAAPSNPDILYAGTVGDHLNLYVYKSTDAGATWQVKNSGIPPLVEPPTRRYPMQYSKDQPQGINALAVDPLNPNIVYAYVFGEGIYRTANGGDSWAEMNNGFEGYPGQKYCLVIDPADRKTLFIATNNGLFTYTQTDTLQPSPEEKKAIAFPNPVRGDQVTFLYNLEAAADVTVRVYTLAKELVATVTESEAAGDQSVRLDVTDLPSGIYLYYVSTNTGGTVENWKRQKLAIIR